jgi:anthranilate phosphoribosyltransferase
MNVGKRTMMFTCYTLARVAPTMDKKVYKAVKSYPEVKDIILTYGEYDLIIRVESNSLEDLDDFIFTKLRTTEGIESTTTLIEARPSSVVKGK